MTGENGPFQHCTLAEPADLRTALDATAIEYLDVDEHRTVVIYQHAVLMVIATKGQATAAQEFDIELWENPPDDPPREPDEILAAFIEELLATTDAARAES